MTAKKVIKSEKRELIIRSAITVFARDGINNSTIKMIADEAGIGKGTVYEYFVNKNEIISQAYHYYMSFFDAGIEEIILKKMCGKDKLLSLLDFIITYIVDDRSGLLNLIFDFWAEGIRAESSKNIMFKEMRRFYVSYRALVSDIISEGKQDGSFKNDINEGSLASLLVGMLDGILVQWIIDRESIDLMKIKKEMVNLIQGGSMQQGGAHVKKQV